MNVEDAIRNRSCHRAFLDKPVSRAIIQKILDIARFAPSGTNTQPWKVAIVTGNSKQQISDAIIAARKQGSEPNPDYHYYPTQWIEPYKSRRFSCGMALYGALQIERQDTARRKAIWDLNYQFFGAPVGLFFYIDAVMDKGTYLDMGMFLQNVMLAARAQGLETCPQASLSEYPDIVRQHLQLNNDQIILCGLALGYSDYNNPINQYRTDREPVEKFTQWFE
jgi:nitroreductase